MVWYHKDFKFQVLQIDMSQVFPVVLKIRHSPSSEVTSVCRVAVAAAHCAVGQVHHTRGVHVFSSPFVSRKRITALLESASIYGTAEWW